MLLKNKNQEKIVAALAYLAIRTHNQIKFFPNARDTYINHTFKLINQQITPWIISEGGWENAIKISTTRPEEKYKKKNFKLAEECFVEDNKFQLISFIYGLYHSWLR